MYYGYKYRPGVTLHFRSDVCREQLLFSPGTHFKLRRVRLILPRVASF